MLCSNAEKRRASANRRNGPFSIDSIWRVDSKIPISRGGRRKKPSYREKCCRPTALLCSSLRAHFPFANQAHFPFANQAPRALGKISSSRIDIGAYTDIIDTQPDVFIPSRALPSALSEPLAICLRLCSAASISHSCASKLYLTCQWCGCAAEG